MKEALQPASQSEMNFLVNAFCLMALVLSLTLMFVMFRVSALEEKVSELRPQSQPEKQQDPQ